MIVDDSPINLEIAKKILGKESYDIQVVTNGYEALNLIKKSNFDLILLDIMMSGMDGFQTYVMIKQTEGYQDVPVIFLTAKTDIESMLKGFELGAVDYIRKPFNGLELRARVKTHIELKKTRESLKIKNQSLIETYAKFKILATTDPLTKLFNRRKMMKCIEQELVNYNKNHHPFSIVICDIDFFKRINDTYGHNFGDYILMSVAEILKNNIREQDIVSRWGGEEFLLMFPNTIDNEAFELTESLRKKIEENVFYQMEISVKTTMTFGIFVYNEAESLNSLISKADCALYKGKENGRNCVVMFEVNNDSFNLHHKY